MSQTLTVDRNSLQAGAQRVQVLRQRLLERKRSGRSGWSPEMPVVSARSLRASEQISSWQLRRGLLVRDRLNTVQFAINELELLAGRVDIESEEGRPDEVVAARRYLEQYPGPPGQTGHCELDLDPLMSLGISGLEARTHGLMAEATGERVATYRSFVYTLEGLSLLCVHAAETAEAALPLAGPARQAELGQIASSCRRIANQPPASFRDAVQLLWLTLVGVMQGEPAGLVVPGHLDRTLQSYFEQDLAEGRLDRNEALVLLESLYLLINEFIPDGLAIGVMVGGRDQEGRDLTNELSYLCLEALRRTRLIYPTVGLCWHEDTPGALVDLALELVAQGCANPAFFGDKVIQQGLRQLGVPPPITTPAACCWRRSPPRSAPRRQPSRHLWSGTADAWGRRWPGVRWSRTRPEGCGGNGAANLCRASSPGTAWPADSIWTKAGRGTTGPSAHSSGWPIWLIRCTCCARRSTPSAASVLPS